MPAFDSWIANRTHGFDSSGIRRMFDLAAKLQDPLNFFKQKTAYEMESRDWSSDVCSSD
eukprot:COSAG05_NODE_11286_length_521_cov_0.658768_1_plen_58_part_10